MTIKLFFEKFNPKTIARSSIKTPVVVMASVHGLDIS
jgi:hypothetical protein